VKLHIRIVKFKNKTNIPGLFRCYIIKWYVVKKKKWNNIEINIKIVMFKKYSQVI